MKLTAENYYSAAANKEYWSASFIKAMRQCPAAAMAEYLGGWKRPETSALLVGGFVDAFFEGTIDEFCACHPEIVKRDGTLKAEFTKAGEMCAKACDDPVFMDFMDGEKQRIFTGTVCGFPFRGKFDVYNGKRIVDLKTVRDLSPVYKPGIGKVSFAEAWDWPLQMAIYQKIEGNNLPCFLAVITKEEPPDIEIVEIPQSYLDTEIRILEDQMPYFDAVKNGVIEPERCGHCAYCRATKKIKKPISLDHFEEALNE